MTDVIIETLVLRGPRAARLARVAATALPRALEDALSGLPDISLPHLQLELPVGVQEDLDDEALAVLWADAIRVAAVRAIPHLRLRAGNPATAAALDDPVAHEAARARGAAAARRWIETPAPRPPLPAEALAVGLPPWESAPVDGIAGADVAADVVRALDAAIRAERDLLQSGAAGRAPSSTTTLPPPRRASSDRQAARSAGDVPAVPTGVEAAGPPGDDPAPAGFRAAKAGPAYETDEGSGPAGAGAALARLAAIAGLVSDERGELDVANLTRAAGLPLLYPWLADHCRAATAMHPDMQASDVRARALAAVVAPGDPTLADDPLVAVLAGIDPMGGPPTHAPLARQEEVDESAADVLRRFVALLPGFESSTADFVRSSWIVRAGMLDTDLEPVRLAAATRPLDVVLPLLPYPIGLVRLPWSRAVTVRFRP